MSETSHDDGRLRDLLEQAARTTPDLSPADRSTAVVRRGRAARRRDRVLIGAAALAVAAAVAVPLSLHGDDVPEVATPTPASEPVGCPAAPADVTGPATSADLGEVTSVRLCPTVGGPVLASAVLSGDEAAAFAAAVRALPAYAPEDRCATASVAFEPWALAIGRADGGDVLVGSGTRHCSSVSIDGVRRDAGAVVQAFEDRAVLEAPRCDQAPADAGLGPVAARPRAGRICTEDADVPLSAEQTRVLGGDFEEPRGERRGRSCGPAAPARRVVLVDERGVVTTWTDAGCADVFHTDGATWAPSDAALQVIEDALSR